MINSSFAELFRALTDYSPMPWQDNLYHEFFLKGQIPDYCNLPTGLGKTSVIAIWLIALANAADKLPRRLVYVVNRRTVVDQATREAEKLRKKLSNSALAIPLHQLCALDHDVPLAISTLRGQYADNGEWCADPSRPAIVIGTVDMIGSRLLFSGYGRGFRTRPLHAGFLGQDALLVHDEAHLELPFQKLIEAILQEQRNGRTPDFFPFHIMALSATNRKCENIVTASFELSKEEKNPPETLPDPPTAPIHHVWRRIKAAKQLQLHGVEEKDIAKKIADIAKSYHDTGKAILIYCRTLKNLNEVKKTLDTQNIEMLTGTIRGLERDALVNTRVFQRFLNKSSRSSDVLPQEGTVYLICTSAGEVGVDISADHLVCDLTPFDSMAQRFGRVNRFGDCRDTKIDVVYPKLFDADEKEKNAKDKEEYELRRKKTLSLLRKLNGNASPKALNELPPEERLSAFTPTPTILPVSDILFDSWALTTITQKLPGRPPVEPYLHGLTNWEPPETHVAWREEVDILCKYQLLEMYSPKELLEDYPLKPHELLRDTSSNIRDHLEILAQRHPDTPVWIVTPQEVIPTTLACLIERKPGEKKSDYLMNIANVTLILPPSAGGLSKDGMLDGNALPSGDNAEDVSGKWHDENDKPRRMHVWDNQPEPNGMRLIRTIDLRNLDAEEEVEFQNTSPVRHFWQWYEMPTATDNDGSNSAGEPVRLQTHTNAVVHCAKQMAAAMNLSEMLANALILAAKYHDLGKRRELWQRSIGNPMPAQWLAKLGRGMRRLDITRYRHEFGSLLDLQDETAFQNLDENTKDLVMHLIASHHGRARPHFPEDEDFDPQPNGKDVNAIALEIPRRFGQLQRRYGRWGLAYLESLLRAADYAASANPTEYVNPAEDSTND